MIVELTDWGKALQFELDELGEVGWEVYHIERRDKEVLAPKSFQRSYGGRLQAFC